MIRVFIGNSPNGEDAEANAVLEYSIRKHASEEVSITWLKLDRNINNILGGWNTRNFNTPFSSLRFAIPEMCDYEGKAIYLDTDVIVMGDIAELWYQNVKDKCALVRNLEQTPQRSCVALFNCERMGAIVPSISKLKKIPHVTPYIAGKLNAKNLGIFTGKWNCIDLKGSSLNDPELRAIHYSSIAHQLHLKHAIPRLLASGRKHWYDGKRFDHWRPELIELFDDLLIQANRFGYKIEHYDPRKIVVNYKMMSYRNVIVKGYE